MKRLLQNIIALILLLCPMCMAASSVCTLMLSKVILSESPDEKKETPIRQRTPSATIECVITQEGISVQNSSVNLADAISYELWEADADMCVAVYSDEISFIDGLFSMTGEFQIRFIFEDYELIGYLCCINHAKDRLLSLN